MLLPILVSAVLLVVFTRGSQARTEGIDLLVVNDFEYGLDGWFTNDAGRNNPSATPYVQIDISNQAHSGKGALEMSFSDVKEWAAATYSLVPICLAWAEARVDTLNLWVKGDGREVTLTVGFQGTKDDMKPGLFHRVQVPVKGTDWLQVSIPFEQLQASQPEVKLRAISLYSLYIGVMSDIAAAKVLIDDITVSRRGTGTQYLYAGIHDAAVKRLPPARKMPRLGNWSWPFTNPEYLEPLQKLGLGFSDGITDGPALEMFYFTKGWLTNVIPNRLRAPQALAGLGLTSEDIDQDSQGHRADNGFEGAVYHPEVITRMNHSLTIQVAPLSKAPWVTSFIFTAPTSMYGELHFPMSTTGQYMVFSRPAKQSFRAWLRQAYAGSLSALRQAWGEPVPSWDVIVPPDGHNANGEGLDISQKWSDFIHWYNWCMLEIARNGYTTMRNCTRKPIEGMLGGPKVGMGQGIELGNIGPMMKMLGSIKPALFNDTDAQTLYSVRYSQTAARHYGVTLMVEHVGPPYLALAHQYEMLLNGLAVGASVFHLAHLGELFQPEHFFAKAWRALAPVVREVDTPGTQSKALMFHSYMTAWYRKSRNNADGLNLYDGVNTLWSSGLGYPSWGRVLDSPGVADDQMVEDGVLKGHTLLVIPNASVTVTSQKAVRSILDWVKAGGMLIGFGEGCLGYTVLPNRQLRPSPGFADTFTNQQLADARKQGLPRLEKQLGKGRVVLYLRAADVEERMPDGSKFVDWVMPQLANEAAKAGVKPKVTSDAGDTVNPLYAGQDRSTRRHIFTLDTIVKTRGSSVPVFVTNQRVRLLFDKSLRGEAELINITDSFESVQGGKAAFDADDRVLRIRFSVPTELVISYGDSASGIKAARHPLLFWDHTTLVLSPAGEFGVRQTQEPITVGADGSLSPADVKVTRLIHGDMHRANHGRGPTFQLQLRRKGAVHISVNSVSTDAVLVVYLDAVEVLRQMLSRSDSHTVPPVGEIHRTFSVDVPAGEHTVKIDNLGADWMSIDDYRFEGL